MQAQPDLNALAIRAKNSDEEFGTLVTECRAFILSCAGRTLNRYVTENDDAWSIALHAFYEAVRSYDPVKGSFLSFASLVINRRLKDMLAAEYRRQPELLVGGDMIEGSSEDETDTALQNEIQTSIAHQSESASGQPGTTPLQDEIEALGQTLNRYGFSFFDLPDASPKAEKTKRKCAAAIREILKEPGWVSQMQTKCQLPMKELSKKSKVPLKTLEQHRRYIIAAVEILNGDFPLLAEYMKAIK